MSPLDSPHSYLSNSAKSGSFCPFTEISNDLLSPLQIHISYPILSNMSDVYSLSIPYLRNHVDSLCHAKDPVHLDELEQLKGFVVMEM